MHAFFSVVTVLGDPSVIVSVFAAMLVIVAVVHRKHILTTFLGALVSGLCIVFILKDLIDRTRPTVTTAFDAYGSSFPSGHALMSVICYGFVGLYLWRYVGTRLAKILGVLIGTIVPFLVGLSRIYLGLHYVSDVVAGWILGALILMAWSVHLDRAERRDKEKPHIRSLSRLFVFVVVGLEIVFIFGAVYLF